MRPGVIRSAEDLIAAILDYIDHHNDNPKPFIWTLKPVDIRERVKRAQALRIVAGLNDALHPGVPATPNAGIPSISFCL